MMKSMTGFGRATAEAADKDVTVEIKAVNGRYFDCSVHMPRAYGALEEKVKAYIQKNATARGKVDVSIGYVDHGDTGVKVTLNEALAGEYIAALRQLRDAFDLRDDISVMSVARQGDILTLSRAEADMDGEWERLQEVLSRACADFLRAREAEGKRLAEDIRLKIERIRACVTEIEKISEKDIVGYRDKLESRLRQILSDNVITVDEQRLLTESAIWADKLAIDEEVVRLNSHFRTFEEIAAAPEPSGRKLDFLMQEMNREINTIGSKANNAAIAAIVVTVKGELEKIREQIQNIE